jgi:hypothetical protein
MAAPMVGENSIRHPLGQALVPGGKAPSHTGSDCVISITARAGDSDPNSAMEYKGVRYAILVGTARQQWRVAIYPVPNQLPKETTVVGTREDAEITARSMINAWLKKALRTDTIKR